MATTEKGRTTTINDLTDDLTVEILQRMPRSSILQCLNVSKRWRSLIRNGPLFLPNTINVVASYNGQGLLRCMCLEKGKHQFLKLGVANHRRPYDNWIISSCNGLLLFYFSRDWGEPSSECYISNPWTEECVCLPKPTMTSRKFTMCGLAFENNSREENNDVASYKIVMAHRINPYTMEGRHNYSYKFEMYSSVKKRWQLLKCVSEPHPCRSGPRGDHYDLLGQSGVYCNRVLYWHCPLEDHALMFNLETETSGYMELPSIGDNVANPCGRILTVCDGLLHYSRVGFPNHQYRLSVWRMSMETSGWLMLNNVSLDLDFFPVCRSNYMSSPHLKPIGISCQGGDKVLLAEYSSEIDKFFRIISYDFNRDVLEVVLQKDFLRDFKFCRYTPTNKSIIKRVFLTQRSPEAFGPKPKERSITNNVQELIPRGTCKSSNPLVPDKIIGDGQQRIKAEKSKQKGLFNYAGNLLGCFKSPS